MSKGNIRKLVVASVLACAATASQAALVEAWTYTVDMAWTDAVFSTGTGTTCLVPAPSRNSARMYAVR
jgi:hypothetical protein